MSERKAHWRASDNAGGIRAKIERERRKIEAEIAIAIANLCRTCRGVGRRIERGPPGLHNVRSACIVICPDCGGSDAQT